jgi:hypothetical protein
MTWHLIRCALVFWVLTGVSTLVRVWWLDHDPRPLVIAWLSMPSRLGCLLLIEWIFRRNGISYP